MTDQPTIATAPPKCFHCNGPCPDDPTRAFRLEWGGMMVGYLCSAECAKARKRADPACANSDGSLWNEGEVRP